MFNTILTIISVILLILALINVCIYYKDVKQIQDLKKEKLKLEIEYLKEKLK
jgi:high-affinity nickel permease